MAKQINPSTQQPTPLGPRPLSYHLGAQVLTWISCLGVLPHWKNGSLNLNSATNQNGPAKFDPEKDLKARAQKFDDATLQQAVLDEVLFRLREFSKGVNAYHQHPRIQRLVEPPILAQVGSARLLDYGALSGTPSGAPVLIVPSLINRAYILDLTRQNSLVRYMAKKGLRPLLVDWGSPGDTEAAYDLESYITGPLQTFFNLCSDIDSRPTTLIGYCMGGLLALALASRNPSAVNGLALLATPWDFHAGNPSGLVTLKSIKPGMELVLDELGHLPVDILQAMFASLNPSLTGDKFRAFAQLSTEEPRAQSFVALEDWLNDGVPLAPQVARDCLFGWYLENATALGKWKVDNQIVSPELLTCRTLSIIPKNDHIVPPGSAQALADILPHNETRLIKAGHIGMVAGRHAKSTLYEPLVEWIQSCSK